MVHPILGFRCAPPQALCCRLLSQAPNHLSLSTPGFVSLARGYHSAACYAGWLINDFQITYSQEILSPLPTQGASHPIVRPILPAWHRSFWLSLGLRKARRPLPRRTIHVIDLAK